MIEMSTKTKATAVKPKPRVQKAASAKRTAEARPQPASLPAQVLDHQKTVGNRAVQRLIQSGSLRASRKAASPARRSTQEKEKSNSSHPAAQESILSSSPLSHGPVNQASRAATRAGATNVPAKLAQNTRDSSSLKIDRAWYNFDIPFTNYQFDPSISGIKTAAGVVKDTAVGALDWIVDEIKGLVSAGIDWVKEKWHDLEDFASSAFDSIKTFFGSILRMATSPLQFLANAIMNFDGQTVAKAWASFSGMLSSLADRFKATVDGALQQVNKIWGVIDGYATSLLNRISGLTGNFLFKKLPDALQRIALTAIETLKAVWKSINGKWTALFNKIKAWCDAAIDKVFSFVRRVLSFGINVVINGIIQFGHLVLFLKDLFSNPQKYIAILAEKSAKAFDGVESRFAGLIGQYFPGGKAAQPAAAGHTVVQKQAAPAAAAEPKTSATWSDIGHGVLGMMKKKWDEFKSNPLSIVTGLLKDLFIPMLGNIQDVIKLYQDIKKIVTGPLSADSLEDLWTSILQILDIPILIYQTIVSILMRSLMVPLIVATFVPHPLVKAIAAAVGEVLLAAFIGSEVLNIEHKILLLKTGATIKAQKEDAYNRVADGLIALIMAGVVAVIMLILHFIANILKGVYNFVKGKIFSVEAPAVSGEGRATGEGKGKGIPEDAKAADAKARGIPSEDGQRRIRINEEGQCEVCASPCEKIRRKYAAEMTPEEEKAIKAIESDTSLTDAQREEKLKPIEQKLAEARQKLRQAETPEQKVRALKDISTEARKAIEKIRESFGKRENLAKWRANSAKKAGFETDLRELEKEYTKTIDGAKGIEGEPGLLDLARDEFENLREKAESVNSEIDKTLNPAGSFDVDTFEKKISTMSPGERVAAVSEEAEARAASKGYVRDTRLSALNGRDVYVDPASGDIYSVDTQHGRFEHCNARGTHQGEVNFNFESTKEADKSGLHDVRTR